MDVLMEPTPNKYSLDGLQKTALSLMTALIITTFIATNLQAVLWQSSQWLVSTVLPATVIDLTNDEREDQSLTPLRRSSTLDAAAKLKAQHMAQNEYFSHFSPDGVSPWYWFDQSGYVYAHAGENLAIYFTDSTEVVEAWMQSPTHRENIVSGKYTEIGVGTAKGSYEGYDTVYVVQLFGTPGLVAPLDTTPEPEPVLAVNTEPAPVFSPEPEVIIEPEVLPEAEVESAVVAQEAEITSEPQVVLVEPVSENQTLPAVIETPETVELVEEPVVIAQAEPESVTPAPAATQESVFVESPLIATSSGLAVANFTESSEPHAGATVASIATQPNELLQFVYLTIALVVLLLLSTSIVLEAKKLRFIQVAYSLALVLGMGGLWFVNSLLTSGAVIV